MTKTKDTFKKAIEKNQYKIILLSELKDDAPILAVSEYPAKRMAEFFLVDKVIIPIGSDWEIKRQCKTK